MEVIIKPTGRCNFNCTFCSAHDMSICHPVDGMCPDQIKQFILDTKPKNIIVTGGEPLMVPPSYYYDLFSVAKCDISITSNLKDFYLNPEKWAPLFNEEWFSAATSFNYGSTRMWDANTVYTESMFLDVIDRYKQYCPNKPVPSFIAVIDYDNEHTVMDHVKLAKKIGSYVKLNPAIKAGKQSAPYPRYKMYQHYIDIIDAGYGDYEVNCLQRQETGRCAKCLSRECQTQIRCIAVGQDGELHVSICDEQLSLGHEIPKEKWNMQYEYIPIPAKDLICEECTYCELYYFCNSCDTFREDAKLVPGHCEEMKSLYPALKAHGFRLEV